MMLDDNAVQLHRLTWPLGQISEKQQERSTGQDTFDSVSENETKDEYIAILENENCKQRECAARELKSKTFQNGKYTTEVKETYVALVVNGASVNQVCRDSKNCSAKVMWKKCIKVVKTFTCCKNAS